MILPCSLHSEGLLFRFYMWREFHPIFTANKEQLMARVCQKPNSNYGVSCTLDESYNLRNVLFI